ncbi:MAG: serine/threonine protein kinase [Nannocystaceae bacterium]|nr:serine/threonine protein kinase [Nannocystaceae bacterium]
MTVDAPGMLPVGSHVGRYQIIRRLALGGMAELYLARQLGDAGYEKVVALKRVLPHLAEDPAFVTMFLNEARLASALNHSAIAQVMDFGTEAGEHFMTLEYVHGRSVLQLLREAGRALPRAVALTIIHEVAGALHYAHERNGPDGQRLGLVHRDVSPSNVLVSYDGDVKLVDFGIAKATAHSQATQTAAIKGKIAYMAPEQLRGDTLDRRSDVFALCVVFYELVLGKRCFSAPGEFALINRVAEARFTKPSKVDPEIEPEVEALISQGLSADPDGRPKSARELQLRIEALAAEHGLRLSKVGVAEFMEQTFGVVDFPRTDSLPLPTAWPVESMPTVVEATPIPHARTSWPWLVVALAVGMTGGIAAVTMAGETPPEASSTVVEPAPIPAVVVSQPPSRRIEAEAEADENVLEPAAPEVEVEADPEPPQRHRPSRKKKRRRRASTKDKPVDKPRLDADYLPPSRRSG